MKYCDCLLFMLTLGEKIALMFPSAYFAFSYILKAMSLVNLGGDLAQSIIRKDKDRVANLLISKAYEETFIEFLIVMFVNGLHLSLILFHPEIGIIAILVGVILFLIGNSFTRNEMEFGFGSNSFTVIRLCISISLGMIVFFWFFDNSVFLLPYPSSVKWIAFGTVSLISYWGYWDFASKLNT